MYRMSKDTNDIDESSCRFLNSAGRSVPAELYREFMQDIVAEIDRENVIISDLLSHGETRQESSAASDHNSKYQRIVRDYHEAFKTIGSAA